jgi:hypothetical protein
MKSQLIAVIVMLAIGLQGSVVAFAGTSPLMSTDCQTAAISHSGASQDSCCPKGQHTMSCWPEAAVLMHWRAPKIHVSQSHGPTTWVTVSVVFALSVADGVWSVSRKSPELSA